MTVLDKQEGGSHYKKLALQPFEFSLTNGWDAAAHSILKYVTRYRDKGGALDLAKAVHIAEYRMHFWGSWLYPSQKPDKKLTMARYLEANKIIGSDATVLTNLEKWVEDHNEVASYDAMVNELKELIAAYPAQTS